MKRVVTAAAALVWVLMAVSAGAQTKKVGGYFDVNFGAVIPAEGDFSSQASMPSHGETSSWSYKYTVPTMLGIDIGGGVMFIPKLGFGVAVTSVASEGAPTITDTEPHPYYYSALATGTLVGETPSKRHETHVHLSVVFRPLKPRSKVQVRIYGGPTYFSMSQDLVSNFWFTETYGLYSTSHTVEITRYEQNKATASTWGIHAGADISYFVSKNIGFGGGVRYAGGTVTIPDTAKNLISAGHTQEIKVGGAALTVGLRVKF